MLTIKQMLKRNNKLFWNLTQILVLTVIIMGYGEQKIQPPSKWLEEINRSDYQSIMVASEIQSVDKKVYTLEIKNSHSGFQGTLVNNVEPMIHFNNDLGDHKNGKSETQKKN